MDYSGNCSESSKCATITSIAIQVCLSIERDEIRLFNLWFESLAFFNTWFDFQKDVDEYNFGKCNIHVFCNTVYLQREFDFLSFHQSPSKGMFMNHIQRYITFSCWQLEMIDYKYKMNILSSFLASWYNQRYCVWKWERSNWQFLK